MGIIQAEFDSAPIKCVTMVTESGHIVLVPAATAEWFMENGGGWLTVKMPSNVDHETAQWLTQTEAAYLLLRVRDDLAGLDSARGCVSYACKSGKIRHIGEKQKLRIDPISFDAWRLAQQEAYLDRLDKKEDED